MQDEIESEDSESEYDEETKSLKHTRAHYDQIH